MSTLNLGSAVAISASGSNLKTTNALDFSGQWVDAPHGTIINYAAASTTSEQTTSSTSYQDFMSCSITPKSSSSHFHIFVFPIRTENRAGIEGNFRVSDGTNVTERYRAQSDSSNGYYTWSPISWYWPLTRTAGTAYTFTVQCRVGGGSGSSVTLGDSGSTSRMLIYEISV